ncbi:MAG: DUF2892 domain-containing protein [Anaerolineae bacterium]|nr:DUF2892 domain-containing protein [Anaerolineae bacterium]
MGFANEAGWDRILRIAAGALLLALGWGGVVTGTLGVVFKWLGFIPLLTGLIGWCPLYAVLSVRTRKG